MHGSCLKPWDCLCDEGWGGLFCNQDLNYCTNHKPCRNGGTCRNTGQGSYTCECPPGFNDTNCQFPAGGAAVDGSFRTSDDCPCFNGGTCDDGTCQCPPGFSGPRCENSAVNCMNKRCLNGGSCTPNGCACAPGYSGNDCEHKLNSCSPNPCMNDGSCVERKEGFKCICPSGFTGEKCEINIDDCTNNPCQNGGTCIDKINEFRCQCVPGFVGPLCQNRVDYCIMKPCANGGTCFKLINDYKCKCAPGFTGKDCSDELAIELDECQRQPCQHGGTCVSGGSNGFECICPNGYIGRECEQASSSKPSARISPESNLTTEHVVVIATISTIVPLVVSVAVGVIICLKQRRKREKARADEEARLQNEQNTANSSFAKRGAAISADAHMIKNSWGKCTNNVINTPDECSVSNISVNDCDGYPKPLHQHQHQVIDGRPVYSLTRTRSQKQLNTDPGSRAACAASSALLLASKLHEPDFQADIKRLSMMSNASAVCSSG